MLNDIERVLLSEQQISDKVKEIGAAISKDFEGQDVLLVGILKGSVVFMADLMRAITIPLAIDFMAVSSYGKGSKSSGVVKIVKDLQEDIEGKNIIVVEDILDSGRTLGYLRKHMMAKGANKVSIVTLLDKPERRVVDVFPDYTGFNVPDEFVVGYGLDYAEEYRNLPFIGVLKPSVYQD
ncbi:MAG: hypoxanthine phosphoribosyltransferase [Oscillospiraceae bacterium]|nr:hypoxanthine phosphoribosyltransferase [Oscillospiraceae bacterium]